MGTRMLATSASVFRQRRTFRGASRLSSASVSVLITAGSCVRSPRSKQCKGCSGNIMVRFAADRVNPLLVTGLAHPCVQRGMGSFSGSARPVPSARYARTPKRARSRASLPLGRDGLPQALALHDGRWYWPIASPSIRSCTYIGRTESRCLPLPPLATVKRPDAAIACKSQ